MKKLCNIALSILIITTVVIVGCCLFYNYQLTPVSDSSDIIEIEIPKNTTTRGIASILKENKLIRDERIFLIYTKIMNISGMKAGYYDIPANTGVKDIVSLLQEGSTKNPNEIQITFKEGINIRKVATVISSNTNNSYDSVMNLLKDESYLDELINDYWFISEDIKNNRLYYSLEGYLFPDTYRFNNKDVTVKEIFKKMLDKMDDILSKYKDQIIGQNKTVHQVLTLASVIEKEGKTKDFGNISSVFHNRLEKNMKLESCATGYYGKKLEFNQLGIATSEVINAKNDYNTYYVSGLPVGPISLPSSDAINASINPNDTENLFFLSDNQGVTYFFKTYPEHQNKQSELIAAGKWYR